MELAETNDLAAAVAHLAECVHGMSDADLGQPYRWGAHQEGVRFALLGAVHELRTLAVHLASERRRTGPPFTRAHHALAQYHAAFRDLNAALIGVSAEVYDRPPAPGEWPLRYVYGHMAATERTFFTLVNYGLRRQREGGELSPKLPDGEADRLFGPVGEVVALMESGTLAEMAAWHATLHDRTLVEFADIDDAEIDGPSVWWEGEPYTLEYRLHRMDLHLRQHTIQIEKSRDQLGDPSGESRRLLRLVYNALSEVEGAIIGAPDLGAAERAAAAAAIRQAADAAVAAVGRANMFTGAVTGGDRERVKTLLAEDAQLVNTVGGSGVPVVRLAIYYGHEDIAEILADAPEMELAIWDAAALGRLDSVTAIHKDWGDFIINDFSHDGFTPLHLAAFFGHEDVVRYLLDNGAAVDAVAQNPTAVRPLHSATAGDHTAIVELLLKAGADPNAEQQGGFRPLHAAAQNGNEEIARLLLTAGADPALIDARGRTPGDLAMEGDHGTLVDLLDA